MIVSCENCGVKLKVDETRIKDTGSKLKCPKCANIFTVFPPQAAQPEPVQAPRPPEPPVAPPQAPEPVQAPPQPQAPAFRPEERKPAREKWRLDNKKIVVAHDGDAILKLIEDILSEAGYETVCTKEGVETVIAIEREKP
ncbi:MAG TPA: zinc-ribbon domain-containing protein, partial [Nitrospirota bacterium]